MKGLLLLIVALILFVVFMPFGIIWQMIRAFRKLNEYFLKIAVCIDQAGNVICGKLLDDVMIKKDGYYFGNEDETVSSVIGKNRKKNTLTFFGTGLYHILNTIQPYHSEKAIEIDETDTNNVK